MKEKDEEKVMMEVTKGEAMFILYDRLEQKWYVELQPLFVLAPGIIVTYLIYEYVSKVVSSLWLALTAALPVLVISFYILMKIFKRHEKKAERLYQEMKNKSEVKP